MENNKDPKRHSLIVFFMIVLLGCSGLLLRHGSKLFASGPLENLKVHVLAQHDPVSGLNESCFRDSSFLRSLQRTQLGSYLDTIMNYYYPDQTPEKITEPLFSDIWLDSLNGQHFLVIRYDLPDNIRALSLIGIKNDSLVSINAFRRNSMVPYTFGPLTRVRRAVFD
ncbi:MAG: hypothetical protein WC372_12865 [Candidatus Neomarinimicrobiota bacterium]|jgi:hypothetical protein